LVVLLAVVSLSSCSSAEPSESSVVVVKRDLAVPVITVVTHTPLPVAILSSGAALDSEDVHTTVGTRNGLTVTATVMVPVEATLEPFIYEVLPGDWLMKIAQKFGLALQELIEANPIINPQNLQPGDRLVIPIIGGQLQEIDEPLSLSQESGFVPVPSELADLAAQEFGDELPLQLRIPVIGIEAEVVPVGWHTELSSSGNRVLWHSPGNAAGFLVSSSIPGSGSNAVFYGHHNVNGSVFRGLDRLKSGDEVTVTNNIKTLKYVVQRVDIFEENNISSAQKLVNLEYFAPTGSDQLTILTCWPFTGNSHRVAVIANPIE
jgi:sortase A